MHAVGVATRTGGRAQALDVRVARVAVRDLDGLDGAAGALAGRQLHQLLGEVLARQVVVLVLPVVVRDVDLAESGAVEDLDRLGLALGLVGDVLQDEAGLAVVAPAHPPGRAGGQLLFDRVGGAAARGRRGRGGLRPGGGRTGERRRAGGQRGQGHSEGRGLAGGAAEGARPDRAGQVLFGHEEVTPLPEVRV